MKRLFWLIILFIVVYACLIAVGVVKAQVSIPPLPPPAHAGCLQWPVPEGSDCSDYTYIFLPSVHR